MANGEPAYIVENGKLVPNIAGGFDPTHPYKNRDPRFYHDIVFDGFKYLNGTPGQWANLQYCQLYTGGNMRPVANGSRTGYFIQKLVPHTCNEVDRDYDWGLDADNAGYLVLVDGVPREATNVMPSEIDQITFLKGAQAVVLYGSKAAKGAVLITTKRGKNDGLKVEVQANAGLNVANGSRTGYFIQKLVPHTCNEVDRDYDWGSAFHCYLPYMRLADIYLMYAEACAAFGGASGKATNFSKTAEDAINTLRDRCGAGHVAPEYVADAHKFMDEVRREREVELAFEGFRFNDLQRWLLLTEAPYNVKYSDEFDRVEGADFYKNNDPADAKVDNFRQEAILTRHFTAKHYWFPLPIKDVYLYQELSQNPGW
jgi:TonB-dependent SusC/RagA subfamily outer membrane receptor